MEISTSKEEIEFTLKPIGRVEREGSVTRRRIAEAYRPGLKGLEDFSHAQMSTGA